MFDAAPNGGLLGPEVLGRGLFCNLLVKERRLFQRYLARERLPHGRDWYQSRDLMKWRLLRTFEELEKSQKGNAKR